MACVDDDGVEGDGVLDVGGADDGVQELGEVDAGDHGFAVSVFDGEGEAEFDVIDEDVVCARAPFHDEGLGSEPDGAAFAAEAGEAVEFFDVGGADVVSAVDGDDLPFEGGVGVEGGRCEEGGGEWPEWLDAPEGGAEQEQG